MSGDTELADRLEKLASRVEGWSAPGLQQSMKQALARHVWDNLAAILAALRRPEPAADAVEAVARALWDYDLSAGLHKGARQWPEARPDQREYYLGLAGAAAVAMAPGQTLDCCPLCGGDCGSANPPVVDCPMRPEGLGLGPRPGDVVAHGAHRWRVCGVHYGAVGQESLIELESLTHEPGWTGEWEHHPRMFVPEVLLRGLTIVRRP